MKAILDYSLDALFQKDFLFKLPGDIFEREEDIEHPEVWRSAGSMNPERQENSRSQIADLANYIVPGHGPMFKVTESMRMKLKTNINKTS